MPRAKRGFKSRRRRNKIMKAAKGFWGGRRRLYRQAAETVRRSWRYGTRDRRRKKREFRRLWVTRINAAARRCGVSYSRLIGWMKRAGVELDRKIMAELAVHDPAAFEKVVAAVRPKA
jgi:large subunit ribosomal protein L20